MIQSLVENHQVVEIASNDGYLLQFFKKKNSSFRGRAAANSLGCWKRYSIVKFFGVQTKDLVATGQQADLLVGNNVLAHVPDVNDFVAGMKILLKPNGIF